MKRVLTSSLLIALTSPLASAQNTPLPYHHTAMSVGVVSCASSLCHGAVKTSKDVAVLQNEYITWSRMDRHADTWRTLFSDRSKKIAGSLGLPNAHEAKVCLDCHADNVPVAQRGERFKIEDGISCEACHGPAEKWLGAHTRPGVTHASNVANGLYALDDPAQRARLCLSCHLGNSDRFVTHRMMAAGHPRLSFELDTFTALQPAHFRVSAEVQAGRRGYDGAQSWAIGQATAVAQTMELLADPKRNHDGAFPELVLFDCHACHHPMSAGRGKPREGKVGPGVVRLNEANLLMVKAIAQVLDPALAERIEQQSSALNLALSEAPGEVTANAQALDATMKSLVLRLEQHGFSARDLSGLLRKLVDGGQAGLYRDYVGAEQATMAITSISNAMYRRGQLASAAEINRRLAVLQASVAKDESYRPEEFQRALARYQEVVQGAERHD